MKPLDQYETPITDSSTMRFRDGDQSIEVVDCEVSRSIERRLAACREALECCRVAMCGVGVKNRRELQLLTECVEIATKTLTITAP